MRIRDQTKNAISSVFAFIIGFLVPMLILAAIVADTLKHLLSGG